MKAHHQSGHVFLRGKTWYLRYRTPEQQPDGTFKNVQKCQLLIKKGEQYRTKKAVQKLADEFLEPYNTNSASLESATTLNYWMEKKHLPMLKQECKESTYRDYVNKWKRYIKPHGEVPLRDFGRAKAQDTLQAIAREHSLSTLSLQHIRFIMSGAFERALNREVLKNWTNPMRGIKLPAGRPPKRTYAYSLDEIQMMLTVLDERSATIVAVACFTGLRDSELRGLKWSDFNGRELRVSRSIWRGKVQTTKTSASEAPVPVIQMLAERLEKLRQRQNAASGDFIFQSAVGTPLDLQVHAQRVIRPTLKAVGIQWHGWHACRRGLATNLHHLHVQDLVIQRILRHSNVSVTQRCYIKTAAADAVRAMEKLEQEACATVVQQSTQPQLRVQ